MGGFLLYRLSCLPFILVLNLVLPLTASASQPDDSGACQNAQLIADENDRLFSHRGTNSRCDRDLDRGWYRFSLNGQPAEIPTSCVKNNHCGTQLPLHLDLGGNDLPGINQTIKGHVCTSFNILGYWDCCVLRMTTYIRNCSGYYVYHLEPTDRCPVAYCLQVESQRPSSHVTAKTGESVGPGQQQSNEDEQSTTTTLPSSATVSSFVSTDSQIETSTSPSTDPPAPEPLAGSSDRSVPSTTPSSNSVTPSSLHSAAVNLSEISMINSSPEQSSTFEITTEIETSGSTEASSKEVATNTTLTPRQTTDISDNTSARTVSSIGANESSSVTNDSTTSVLSNVNATTSTLTTMVSQTQTASLSSPMLAASTDSADRGSSAFVTQSTVSSTERLDRNRTCLNGTDSFLCGNNTCFRGSSQLIMLCQVNSIWQCVQACDVYPDCNNGEDEDQALCGESNQHCTEGTQTCPNKVGCFADCNDPVVSHNYPIRFTINGTAYRDSQERMDNLPPTADVKRAVFESINNITGTRNWDNNSITFQNLNIVDRENFVIDALGIFNISQKGISLSELGGLFQNDTFLDMIARRLFDDSTLVISTSARFVNDTERTSVLPSTSTTISEASTHYATSVRNDGGTTQTSETVSFTSKGMTSTELVEQNENNTTIATNYSGITEDSSEFNMTNVHSTTADSENLASKTTISITVSASMNNTLSTTPPGSVISSSPSSSTTSLESSTPPRAAVSTNNTTTSLQYPSTYTSERQTTSSPITTVQANNILTVDTLTSTISASSKVSTDTISTEISNQTVSDGSSSSTQVATSAVIGTTNVTDEPQSTEQNDQSTAEVSERQDRMTESATLSSTVSAISTQSSSSHVSTAPASSLSAAVSSLPYTNTSTLQTTLQTNQSDTASSPRALSTATMSNIDRITSTESLPSVPLTSTGLSRSSASTVVLPITTQGQLTTKSISSSTSHSGMSTASSLASEETASTESSSPQDNEGLESTSQTHGQTSTIVQLPTTNLRSPSSMFTSGGFTPLSTSSPSTEGGSQTSSDSLPSTDSVIIATTEKVKLSVKTTEQVTNISNDTTEALNTIKTPVDDEEKGDKENIIVEFFNKNTGLFIFIIIAGAAMLGICIFGIAGTIYQRRMRTWTPKINYKDVYPDMEKSMMHFGQERSGIESPIPDVDILQEEQTGEDGSLSKASTLVCGPTPDRIQGTSTRSNDTPVTGASSAVSLNGHANEAYQSDESLDLDGVTPFDELDEQYPRNKFPWIDNAEDTKV